MQYGMKSRPQWELLLSGNWYLNVLWLSVRTVKCAYLFSILRLTILRVGNFPVNDGTQHRAFG